MPSSDPSPTSSPTSFWTEQMSSKIYQWKRFWCPRTGLIQLTPEGFLYDPEGPLGVHSNPDVKPYEKISGTHFLGLLGEPGIGKSHALEAEVRRIERLEVTRHVNLRSYSSEDRLIKDVFMCQEFQDWLHGDYALHIFLDSLDECLLSVKTVATLLPDELKKVQDHMDRLYMRVACRTAEWPPVFEEEMGKLWTRDGVGVYELTPLRRTDVEAAAEQEGIDDQAFLNAVRASGAAPLARTPVTLRFLMGSFSSHGTLPAEQTALYLEGLKLLCDEPNKSRRAAGKAGDLQAEERLILAARLAAVTVFCNRFSIWTGPVSGLPDEDVALEALCGGTEQAPGRRLNVDRDSLLETLNTGLFTSRGENRLGWAHQTYAEFLASWYIVQHSMPAGQVSGLLLHSSTGVVPQLHGVSAWMAEMLPEVRDLLLRSDPEALFRGGARLSSSSCRKALLDHLMRLVGEGRVGPYDQGIQGFLAGLVHDGLEKQIETYLCDKNAHVEIRRTAALAAEVCRLHALSRPLADIALDDSEPCRLREIALYALERIGNDEDRCRLRGLVLSQKGADREHPLIGGALRCLWPKYISFAEMMENLPVPREHTLGSYEMFLSRELAHDIPEEDLPLALGWMTKSVPSGDDAKVVREDPFEDACASIMIRAWSSLESPEVMDAFCEAALKRMRSKHEILGGVDVQKFKEMVEADSDRRRLLLGSLINMMALSGDETWILQIPSVPLLARTDGSWLVDRLRDAKDPKVRAMLIDLIARNADWSDRTFLRSVLSARGANRELRRSFPWHLLRMAIHTPGAFRLYTRIRGRRSRFRPPKVKTPRVSAQTEIRKSLETFEGGDMDAWWDLTQAVRITDSGSRQLCDEENEMAKCPGWVAADDPMRKRVLAAAKAFVAGYEVADSMWLSVGSVFYLPWAGFRALLLLQDQDPRFLENMGQNLWMRWAPVILSFTVGSQEMLQARKRLLTMAYSKVPDRLLSALSQLLRAENGHWGHLSSISHLDIVWDGPIAASLMSELKQGGFSRDSTTDLLTGLLDHGVDEARKWGEEIVLKSECTSQDPGITRAQAVKILLAHRSEGLGDAVWNALRLEFALRWDVIRELVNDHRLIAEMVTRNMKESQLADFYLWLHSEVPPDSGADGGPLKNFHWEVWKDRAIGELRGRGTAKACESVQYLMQKLPEKEYLKRVAREAQLALWRREWEPLSPDALIKLVQQADLRVVQNGDQLMQVVMESLERLEAELQSKPQAAPDLWNDSKKGSRRPKDEAHLSDYVKRHLDRDLKGRGIVVNREVQIERGQLTDIRIDAVPRGRVSDNDEPVSLIIEVKGCWNPKVKDDMKDQLVARYLENSECQNGLYLVGWFLCAGWDDKQDGRRSQCASLQSLEEAGRFFEEQARQLSDACAKTIRAYTMDCSLR